MGVREVQCSHAFWLLLWSLHIRTREFVLCLPREVLCSVWGMCRKTSLTMQTLQLSLTHKNSQNRKVCRKLIFFNSFVKCHAEYWSLWYEWFKSPSGIYWKANRFSSEIFFFFWLKPRACHLNIKIFGTFTYPKEAGLWFLLRNSCYLNCWRFIVLCSAMPYTTILIALQWITRNTLWKYHSRYSMFYLWRRSKVTQDSLSIRFIKALHY